MCVKKLLSILVIGVVAIILPVQASAAGFGLNGSCQKDSNCPDENDYCYSTCTVYVENNTTSLSQIEFTLDFVSGDAVEIIEMTGLNGWELMSGTSTSVSLLASSAVTDSKFNVLEYRIRYAQDTDCTVRLGLDGAEITIDHETTTEVETGAALPLTILACGIGAVAVIYVVTKKNKKLYKI